ncbi:MAG: hypothetical protein K9L21_00355 [Spirochaetia bacterium]|nr:hypothetical protein [Spirochaetia bacterium]
MKKNQKQFISFLLIVLSVSAGANAQDLEGSRKSPQVKLSIVLQLPQNGKQPQLSTAVDIRMDEWKFLVGSTWQKPEQMELAASCTFESVSSGLGTLYASGLPRLAENPFALAAVAGTARLPTFSVSRYPFSSDHSAGIPPGGFVSYNIGQTGGVEKLSISLYGIPPGYNDLTSFRMGIFAGMVRDMPSKDRNEHKEVAAAEETIQVGIVRHGLLEQARINGESDSLYQQNPFGRAASQNGLTAALGFYRETRLGGSGITLLASFDKAAAPGTAIFGFVRGSAGSISCNYMQSIYTDAYPILLGKASSAISAQHAGSAMLTISELMKLSIEVEEVLYLNNQYVAPEELSSRTYAASLLLRHSPIDIRLKDSLAYHYSSGEYSINIARKFDISGKYSKSPLEISAYANYQINNRKTVSVRSGGAVKLAGTSLVLVFHVDITASDRDAGAEITISLPSAKLTLSGDLDGVVKAVFQAAL